MATIWTDADPGDLLAPWRACRQSGSRIARSSVSVPVMTRRRLTARLCIRYVHDACVHVHVYVRDTMLPRLPFADRRQRRFEQRQAEAWALVQQQIGFSDLIFSMPQKQVIPASEPPDGDDSDSDKA